MKANPTIMIRVDRLFSDDLAKSFQVLSGGMYLLDANDELWIRVDCDGTHNVYAKESRQWKNQ